MPSGFGTSCDAAARIELVAGGGDGGSGSPAHQARLNSPFGIEFDRRGHLFIVELEGGHVHRVDPQGILTTISGNGERGLAGDGQPARQGVFNAMHNLAITPNGDVYIADTLNHRVRRIDAQTGVLTTFAGTGKKGYGGDGGPAASAEFDGVYCIAFNPDCSRMVIADLENRRVRAIDMQSGVVETVAGNGKKGIPDAGAIAREAPLVDPRAVAADDQGNVYVLERIGHALRVVDRSGRIRTVVGTGEPGGTGDGQEALSATLRGPKHLCFDKQGAAIIADTDNHLIRKYSPKSGKITRVAGTGQKGDSGLGGPPEQVELNFPHGVFVHRDGTLYIADTYNNRVLKIIDE
ncbi:MAG: hypothetical protein ACKV0T_14225 [Planctomycetales bacterium]